MLHVIKDERLVSKMEGETIFSGWLKQFDGLTWLTLTPLRTTDLLHWKTGKNEVAVMVNTTDDVPYNNAKHEKSNTGNWQHWGYSEFLTT